MTENYGLVVLKREWQEISNIINNSKMLTDVGYDGYSRNIPEYEKKLNDLNILIKKLECK